MPGLQQLQSQERLNKVSRVFLEKLRRLQTVAKHLIVADAKMDLTLLHARFLTLKEQAVYYRMQSDKIFQNPEGISLASGVEHRKFFDEAAQEIDHYVMAMQPFISPSSSCQGVAVKPVDFYYRMENHLYENVKHGVRLAKSLAKKTTDTASRQAVLYILSQAYALCQEEDQTEEIKKLKQKLAQQLLQLPPPADSTASITALLLQSPWCLADERQLMQKCNQAAAQLCIQGYVEIQRDIPLSQKPIRKRVYFDLDNTLSVDDGGVSGTVHFIALAQCRTLILQAADDVEFHVLTSRFYPDLSRITAEQIADQFETAIGKKIFRSVIHVCGLSKAVVLEDKYVEHHAYTPHSARSHSVLVDDQLANLLEVRQYGFSGIHVTPHSTSHINELAAVILPLPTASQIQALRTAMRLYATPNQLSPKQLCFNKIDAYLSSYLMALRPVAAQEVSRWKLPPLGSKMRFGSNSRLHNQHAAAVGLLAIVKRIAEQTSASAIFDDYIAAFSEQWQQQRATLLLACKTHSLDLLVESAEAGRVLVARIDASLQAANVLPLVASETKKRGMVRE